MYPDWPKSDADLVPLPKCDGPKLKPFDFQGPQKIEFLERVGEGLHAHVFKVKILGKIYALKLFRFCYDDDWIGPERWSEGPEDLEMISAFYNYSEPFSAECRAFGRLQETGYEELAVKCHGYVLLSEEHEQAMMTQFSDLDLEFNGNIETAGYDDLRSRFVSKDARPPPIRGIVKDFGLDFEEDREGNIRAPLIRKILRDIIKIQQLGIIDIDVATRQIIDNKLADFSKAITIPHFLTSPELNPHLTPEMISAIELETFKYALNDYLYFDAMMWDWNLDHGTQKGRISVCAFPDRQGTGIKYNLRSKTTTERVYTYVDPRKYDWQACPTRTESSRGKDTKGRRSGQISKRSRRGNPRGASSMIRQRLSTKPPLWYYNGEITEARRLVRQDGLCIDRRWYYEDGFIFPRISSPY
ncbi:kinetochore Sim4 complex subunit FTA2-domain-containing protein [Nemania sp. FL0031]|nr:kinetochore Sim4 complex subunit FTA2-domain-containing protein [Nemania sp. FL0031]